MGEGVAARTRFQAYQFELGVNEEQTHQMLRFAGASDASSAVLSRSNRRSMHWTASVLGLDRFLPNEVILPGSSKARAQSGWEPHLRLGVVNPG
jgi:hypothetical protein